MKVVFGFFLAACYVLSCADHASAFTTKTRGMPQHYHVATASSTTTSSSALQSTPSDVEQQQQKKKTKFMSKSQKEKIVKTKLFASAVLSASLLLGSAFTAMTASPQPAHAANNEGSKIVGQLKGSGLVFKDTLTIERFEDPKVKGVVLYISNFDRPVTEKLSKGNFFNDPSQASVACARTGQKVAIADNINKSTSGEEVFEESRSLLFKTLRVQRVYDEDKK